jgi:hypothetical protein
VIETTLNNLLILNSTILILLVLNQNDYEKASIINQNRSSSFLENFTWIIILFEFILFLIKIKISEL